LQVLECKVEVVRGRQVTGSAEVLEFLPAEWWS